MFEEMKRSQNKNQKKTNTLSLFHVLNMLKDCPAHCAICNAFFSPWKMELFFLDSKSILKRCTNKACKVLEKGAQCT